MIYILVLVFGLILGSFISALTYRIPRGLDFIKGRSFCDECKKDLKWFDNIPLFSYLYYGGKSRCCSVPGGRQKKISIRYPLIELTTGFGTVFLFNTLSSFGFLFIVYYLLFLVTLSIFVIDLEHQVIPDELSWIILSLSLLVIPHSLFENLFSGFLFSLVFLTLYIATYGKGMGLGDVKLAIPLGIFLGLSLGLTWLLTSFILGGIVSFVLLILKKANLKTKIAFGPFMIIAFWITLAL